MSRFLRHRSKGFGNSSLMSEAYSRIVNRSTGTYWRQNGESMRPKRVVTADVLTLSVGFFSSASPTAEDQPVTKAEALPESGRTQEPAVNNCSSRCGRIKTVDRLRRYGASRRRAVHNPLRYRGWEKLTIPRACVQAALSAENASAQNTLSIGRSWSPPPDSCLIRQYSRKSSIAFGSPTAGSDVSQPNAPMKESWAGFQSHSSELTVATMLRNSS